VIHPMELRVFNHLIPRMDIVQLPVFPLPVEWWRFTPGHYMDEFSSLHTRELPVRQWLTGAVPSAGVGTGFSRKAIARAAESNHGRVFDETSLTEDYEMTMRLAGPDMREVFVADALKRGPPPLLVLPDTVLRSLGEDARPGRRPLFETTVAVKEYFPKSFRRAVRQKTRWILGNTLQAWVRLGWRGNFGMRYAFLKDRKVLLGHLAVGVAYVAMALLLVIWIARMILLGDRQFPVVFPADSWMIWVMYANLSLVCAYILIRAYSTWLVYGPAQALLSLPRLFWGSLINISAGVRALWIFLFRSGTVVWDKTDHEFPDEHTS